MTDFSKPFPVTDLDVAFPAVVSYLMPRYEDVPDEFKCFLGGYWNRWQRERFYNGLQILPKAKPGIDLSVAIRHLASIQGSFEPKHEHKESAVAYLASLWLEEMETCKQRVSQRSSYQSMNISGMSLGSGSEELSYLVKENSRKES